MNGTETGLVVRQEQELSETYLIVGQAVFDEAACGFQQMPHQDPMTKMTVQFDAEDLLLFACQDLYKTAGEDPESRKDLRRYETIYPGEMMQVAELEELRFVTSVVATEEPTSSHAEMSQEAEKNVENEEYRDMKAKLQARQLHLNS